MRIFYRYGIFLLLGASYEIPRYMTRIAWQIFSLVMVGFSLVFWVLLGSACWLRKRAGDTSARSAGESVWIKVPADRQLEKASRMSRATEANCLALWNAGELKGAPAESRRTKHLQCAMAEMRALLPRKISTLQMEPAKKKKNGGRAVLFSSGEPRWACEFVTSKRVSTYAREVVSKFSIETIKRKVLNGNRQNFSQEGEKQINCAIL